jgi:hypothetical protein
MRMRSLRGLWLAALLGVSHPGAAGNEALLAATSVFATRD